MKTLFITIGIGLIAALIDIAPMIVLKLDKYFILSAFSFWIAAVFIIHRINLLSIPWLNGILVVWIIFIPVLMLIVKVDKSALIQVSVTTTLLGAAAGWALNFFLA